MEEGRLAYRVRTADGGDAAALRDAIGTTLAHPDNQGRRASYSGAASRGDILVLERYDRAAKDWQVAGFVECHMRVDDNLSIRDVGTTGDEPQIGVIRYLLDQAFNSFKPVEAQVKIRRDASTWMDIFRAIPGFYLEGEEYRRPHYWTIWRWDRDRARQQAGSSGASVQPGQRLRPRPTPPGAGPTEPSGPAQPARGAGPPPRGPRPTGPAGPRPGGSSGPPQRGPRPSGGGAPARPSSGPRPSGSGGSPPRGPRPSGGPNAAARPSRPPGPRPGRPPGRSTGPTNPR